ncbi:MAG: TetR/AcrR family transcriptional regulator [Gammaproteobacteria bacterium]|jgi:AcrR family transcriptional regulator
MPETSRPRDKRDRKATEEAIVSAFEAVLLRDGVAGLGVNAVAHEAGVNKVLIYRYFGDLAGLARHWASNSSFWPSELELIGNDPEAFARLTVTERVRSVLCNYIDAIRARPSTIEMLAGELMSPNDVTRALSDGMVGPGKGVGDYIKLETAGRDIEDQVWRLIYLVNTVTAYMAIRERSNPLYLGFDLTDDDAWTFLRDTVAEVTDKYLKE